MNAFAAFRQLIQVLAKPSIGLSSFPRNKPFAHATSAGLIGLLRAELWPIRGERTPDAAKLLNYQTAGSSKGPYVAWTEDEILNFLQAKHDQAHA